MTDFLTTPYVGPRSFEEGDSSYFFGRDPEARELLSLVISEPLVLFYAQSGAGKSSIINTRLIPGLREEGFSVLPIGRVSGTLPPGITDINNIFVFNLLLSLSQGQQDPAALTRTSLTEFLQANKPETPPDSNFESVSRVLIIDQFEEIVTTHLDRWQERPQFFRQIKRAMRADPFLWVVITIREDYVTALDPYVRLLPGKLRTRYPMERMGREAAQEAVTKPAELGGRPFAPGVAEALVDNLRQIRIQQYRSSGTAETHLGQYVEPVQLQVVCYQLWENLKDRPAGEITAADLEELGDVDTALGQFYEQALEQVLEETGESEIFVRGWFEDHLITEARTRNSVYRGLEQTVGLDNKVIDLLTKQFLLRAEIRAGGTWYTLVHDRFVDPILQANQAWRLRQSPLIQAAQDWERSDRHTDLLYRGQQLADTLSRVNLSNSEVLEPIVAEFLAASAEAQHVRDEEEARKQRELEQAQALAKAESEQARVERQRAAEQAQTSVRLRRFTAVIAVVAVVALIAAGSAIYASVQAERNEALANAAKETAEAEQVRADSQAATAEAESERADTEAALAKEAEATAIAESERADLSAEQAQEAEVAAQSERRIARAGQLAAQSRGAMQENRPQVSLLLALEAVGTLLAADEGQNNEAESALRQALSEIGGQDLSGQNEVVYAMAASLDGSILISVDGTGALSRWDMTQGESPAEVAPRELRGPPDADLIDQLIISADNRWLASRDVDGFVYLWDLNAPESSDAFIELFATEGVTDIAFSPDSRWLANGNSNGLAELWDLSAPEVNDSVQELTGHTDAILAVAFSPDSRWLATAGSDQTTHLWDIAEGNPEAPAIILEGHTESVTHLAFSSDSQQLATGSNIEGIALLWDLGAPNVNSTSPLSYEADGFVTGLAFSPTGRQLAVTNQNGVTRVWDLLMPNPEGRSIALRGHREAINDLRFIAENVLITASEDHTIRLWDLGMPMIDEVMSVTLNGHDGPVSDIATVADGRWLVSLSRSNQATTRLWDLATADQGTSPVFLRTPGTFVTSLAVAPNNQWVAVGRDDGTTELWDIAGPTASGPVASTLDHAGENVLHTTISPNSNWLATSGRSGGIHLWSLPRNPPDGLAASPTLLSEPGVRVATMLFSSDSRWLLAGDNSGLIWMWDLSESAPNSSTLLEPVSTVSAMALNDQAGLLAAGTAAGTIHVWQWGNNSETPATDRLDLPGQDEGVETVVLSQDGKWLAAGYQNGVVRWWNLTEPDWPDNSVVLDQFEDSVRAMAFSLDNGWLVATDIRGEIDLWDLLDDEYREFAIALRGHEASVNVVTFSEDSQWLLTAGADGTARLWQMFGPEPATSALILPDLNNRDFISAAAFSQDGRWVVTEHGDDAVRLWPLSLEDLLEIGCRTAGRNMSLAEWDTYFPTMEYRRTCPQYPDHYSWEE